MLETVAFLIDIAMLALDILTKGFLNYSSCAYNGYFPLLALQFVKRVEITRRHWCIPRSFGGPIARESMHYHILPYVEERAAAVNPDLSFPSDSREPEWFIERLGPN